ncbi:MAG: deoxyribodipyrimidine photo-lyase [Solirubrobacteraceae bacterium]|nr:deoxyribodipyrimidine photo-lyase [Solirubrobacteraceae bacterium]
MPTTHIVWFRRDLRVHDHPSLTAAARAADRVVAVFVLDDALLGGRFPSAPRARFLLACLHELRAALADRGATLVVRHGRPERELPALARETGAEAVHFASDVSPYATGRDRRVTEALREAGVEAVRHPGNFVADVSQPRTRDGRPFAVFTPFWNAWTGLERREVHGAPRSLATPSDLRIGEIPAPPGGDRLEDPIEPGERAGRAAMHAWLRDGIDRYADRHDALSGGTSELSPYLHFGCISARELEQRACDAGTGAGPAAYVRQLCWRDFYAHVLLNNPGNARHAHQRRMDALEWSDDEEGFEAWCEGRTGFPVVDAGMRQLRARGWMHNRARLIVASFLTKDLHVDWRRGEAHFMRLLLDGDEAQNNGNWQWISSVGVDPAPYFRRMYNPMTQQERHDPTGAYVRRWVPELRDVPDGHLVEPWRMSAAEQAAVGCEIGRDYPEPIVDHKAERERAIARYRAVRG